MMINRLFSYFFINSKINSLLDELTDQTFLNNALSAKSIYKIQIRRYLGLGFFLSFIPGTEAFIARINLLSVIESCEEQAISWIVTTPFYLINRAINVIADGISNESFLELLQKKSWGINRLNPFFYLMRLRGYALS
ncbi:MAG: hypothetical protein H0U70_11840 [Tatlockia sp.]|nr:hypothetical protein [Tatlockia sp.]